VLTNRNEGARFTQFRRGLVRKLRNIAYLERPVQAISLQAAVLTAERGRARQYEARAYLESQQRAAVELERLVAKRTAALEEANDRLRAESERRERAQAALLQAQKIETMGQLVGGVAHDFNNLLMAIIGNLDLLAKRIGNNPGMTRFLEGALEGARRGATLTQRLLAFARRQELQSRPTDVITPLEDMRGLIGRSVGPMIEVKIIASGAIPAVNIDPNQLEMALLNLAVNARDAMPAGGLLTIHTRPSDRNCVRRVEAGTRRLRSALGPRHRRGHGLRDPRPSRRTIFFDERNRQGNGPWSLHGARSC
jgi:signal transduction histidine kinase